MRRPYSLAPCECGYCHGWQVTFQGKYFLARCREDHLDLSEAVDILNGISFAAETHRGRVIAKELKQMADRLRPLRPKLEKRP